MELIKAQRLAQELMTKHGLISPVWTFKFDNARRRFGVCRRFNRKAVFSNEKIFVRGEISLSKPLVLINDETKVRDTILHEIAHALTPGHGHDAVWKRKCVEIGAKPQRCYTEKDTNTLKSTAKYQATCGGCGVQHGKHRIKPQYMVDSYACKCQSGKPWSERIKLNFVDTKR